MNIQDAFEVGSIMEWEDKSSKISKLDDSNCVIVNKTLNNKKIILHLKRTDDDSEGKVFVRLKDQPQPAEFGIFKKLLGSKKIIGLSLSEFKKLDIEGL